MSAQLDANAEVRPRALVVTALPVEFRAVREQLQYLGEEVHPAGTIYSHGHFRGYDRTWDVFVVEIGANNQRAAFETERAISHLHPQVALFVGVAGGLKDVKQGDVVAAVKVYNYESGKVAEEFFPRPDVGESSYSLVQRARVEASRSDWQRRIKGERTAIAPVAVVGHIAAGERVLANTRAALFDFLRRQYGDAVAVEMEGRGFLVAAHANAHVEALVVRGVSDLVDGKARADGQGWQEVASRHASAFAFEVLARYGVNFGAHRAEMLSGRRDAPAAPPTSDVNSPPKRANKRVTGAALLLVAVFGAVGYWELHASTLIWPAPKPKPATHFQGSTLTQRADQAHPSYQAPVVPPRPSLVGPVGTVSELRATTAVKLPTEPQRETVLQQLPPGRVAFVQPWNINPSAPMAFRRTTQEVFEVHRLGTGKFLLIGGVSRQDANELKAGARVFNLYPDVRADGAGVVGIPFEMIRSTQPSRSSEGGWIVRVELATL